MSQFISKRNPYFSACKFINGDWSACNPETNQMTRTDTVTSGSADFCGTTRVLTKKCNKKGKKSKFT